MRVGVSLYVTVAQGRGMLLSKTELSASKQTYVWSESQDIDIGLALLGVHGPCTNVGAARAVPIPSSTTSSCSIVCSICCTVAVHAMDSRYHSPNDTAVALTLPAFSNELLVA